MFCMLMGRVENTTIETALEITESFACVLEKPGRTFLCFGKFVVPVSLASSGAKTPGARCRQGYGVVLEGRGATMGEDSLWDSESILPLCTPYPLLRANPTRGEFCLLLAAHPREVIASDSDTGS